MKRPSPLRALIFDLDGVLTDTAHLHFLAWRELAQSLDLPFDEAFNEQLKGIDRMGSLDRILAQGPGHFDAGQRLAMAEQKNRYYQQLIATMDATQLLPGARAALEAARAAGLKTALASVSRNAAFVIDRLGIAACFDHVVDAARIAKPKPDPEIFLTAAQALGVAPSQCIGIEDAVAGIAAIKAAGMYAIGVGRAEQLTQADEVVSGLDGLDLPVPRWTA